jgi:hypothetical protein
MSSIFKIVITLGGYWLGLLLSGRSGRPLPAQNTRSQRGFCLKIILDFLG